jgi:hypothetical protein
MGTQKVQMKGFTPWLVRWAHRASTNDFYPALAALVSPVQNVFFIVHYFNLRVPNAQQPESFAQSLLLADFKENHTLLWF